MRTHAPFRWSWASAVIPVVVCLSLGLSLLIGASPAAAQSAKAKAITTSVLQLLNRERRLHHLPVLRRNADLVRSASAHDTRMAARNVMAHQLPGEPSVPARIRRAGYRWRWAGENIAWTTNMSRAGAIQLERLMYLEKAPDNGHRLNILNRRYRDVGIVVRLDQRHHKLWLTEDFGRH